MTQQTNTNKQAQFYFQITEINNRLYNIRITDTYTLKAIFRQDKNKKEIIKLLKEYLKN